MGDLGPTEHHKGNAPTGIFNKGAKRLQTQLAVKGAGVASDGAVCILQSLSRDNAHTTAPNQERNYLFAGCMVFTDEALYVLHRR